ncbi:MAG: deoxyribonuclease I [Planctomycetota bacterium]
MSAYPFQTMDESPRGNPLFTLLFLIALIGGGIYVATHYNIEGLDGLKISSKSPEETEAGEEDLDDLLFVSTDYETPRSFSAKPSVENGLTRREVRPIRIASWALDGFGPTKLARDESRINLIRMMQKFDLIALQQINAIERDIIPRLVDEMNEGGRSYDYVLGPPTGPPSAPEQLAMVFDIRRLRVDRTQTYSVDDPSHQMSFDPLVAWFQTAQPKKESAWTFTFVNVRVDLARAPQEVALLPGLRTSIRTDGRGEDDVVMAGLFQADDAYLIKRTMGENTAAAVRSKPTDLYSRHQTSNLLIDSQRTSEFLGRGGPVDFLRLFNLEMGEAEALTSHLPVFADFSAREGNFEN